MAIYLSTVFSTFDMDKSGKIRRNHWKERHKIIKLPIRKNDLLQTIKIFSSSKLQNFTDACMLGAKTVPTIQQTSLNFRTFGELYLCLIETYHVVMTDFPELVYVKS